MWWSYIWWCLMILMLYGSLYGMYSLAHASCRLASATLMNYRSSDVSLKINPQFHWHCIPQLPRPCPQQGHQDDGTWWHSLSDKWVSEPFSNIHDHPPKTSAIYESKLSHLKKKQISTAQDNAMHISVNVSLKLNAIWCDFPISCSEPKYRVIGVIGATPPSPSDSTHRCRDLWRHRGRHQGSQVPFSSHEGGVNFKAFAASRASQHAAPPWHQQMTFTDSRLLSDLW